MQHSKIKENSWGMTQKKKMYKYDEQLQLDRVNGALKLRPEIEKVVDEFQNEGFSNIFFLGIGGTWASALQVEIYMKSKSSVPVFVENAAEYLLTGNRKLTEKSVVIFSSVTGSTEEMVKALHQINDLGARIFGFLDKADSPLVEVCDWVISYPENEQLKLFMVANRLMNNAGEFEDYNQYNQEMENHLAQALVDVDHKANEWAEDFAKEKYQYYKERPDMPHYFVGAGNQYGATYSYAMCYWEEQLWIRTKSIQAAEFFHGMFEIVEAGTPVTVFLGEDEQRPLAERVKNFLPRITDNYLFIDSKDYELKGISEKYRGSISHLVMMRVNNRIDVYMEREFRHPMEIRRYYRQLDY